MKKFIWLLILGVVASGCATTNHPNLLADKIRQDDVEVRRYLIVGEGVPEGDAVRLAKEANAYAVYTPDRGAIANFTKTLLTHGVGPSASMKMAMEDLRAIGESGQKWEILVTDYAKGYFAALLKNMETAELLKVNATVYLPDTSRSLDDEIKRVFGQGIEIKYISR